MRKGFVLLLLAFTISVAACGSKYEGKYSNANGSIMLDLQSGGKASFTALGETQSCTYSTNKNQIALDCKSDLILLTLQDDNSLTGPAGSMVGVLKKAK